VRYDTNNILQFHLPVALNIFRSDLPTKTPPTDYNDILCSIQEGQTLQQKSKLLPQRFRDIIGTITIPEDDGKSILDALHTGDALLASDGSYMLPKQQGTHAYKLISLPYPELAIEGFALSPNSNMMSSSPTEHYGAIAILTTLIVLLDFHSDIQHKKWPTTVLLIDNEEVVKRGNRLNPTFMNMSQYLTHDYDLWLVLSSLQLQLPMTIEFEWIKSHQQDDDDETIMTKIGLNNDVD
jgi:hypothetical protein